MSFLGYMRPDGSVGTRNQVLVIPQGLISKSISDFVVGTKTIQNGRPRLRPHGRGSGKGGSRSHRARTEPQR